jgi:Xaa-Pro aminopeptidase
MNPEVERSRRLTAALTEAGMDAVVCALPVNVLLLSGYWPVVGTAVAIATRAGAVYVLAPEDEQELATRGWADEVQTFAPGSLAELKGASEAVRGPLCETLKRLGTGRGRVVGYETGECSEPASYVALHLYGGSLQRVLAQAFPFTALVPADGLLAEQRAPLTPVEQTRVRAACHIAERAFLCGARYLRPGLRETEVAAKFRAPLSVLKEADEEIARADGFVFCMSGPNAAKAYAAYQRSRARNLTQGDLALVHCNSYADGYWTDITRTFCLGEPDERARLMYEAVFAARQAALATIRPGASAAAVDAVARQVLAAYGFGAEFKHGLGHGVGFAAIDHNARPRLHPASPDVLETGMVFNIEPAIYIAGYGGLRHCDMVVVTATGVEVLTPFQSSVEELTSS